MGVEENDKPASVLSSFTLSCVHIKQGADRQSSEVDWESLMSGAT